MTNQYTSRRFGRVSGFSLIEVMVAAVVLATGLLALAALQGALARNSADAKARSAIMSALSSRMSQLRQFPPATDSGPVARTCANAAWVCPIRQEAGIGGALTINETVQTLLWKGGTFAPPAVGDDLSNPSFRRITLAANWVDATGSSRALTLRSDASGNIYGDNGYPEPPLETSSAAKLPIVRQGNPSNTAGVIPIASGNQATAASNPEPLREGQAEGVYRGTRFDVLTYIPEGSTAKITKRFDTKLIKCRCEFGAAGYSVAGEAQWPAAWNGETYEVADESGEPAGKSKNSGEDADYSGGTKVKGKAGNRAQSEQCTECCRDHHDTASSPVKFDPESGGDYRKFNVVAGARTAVASGKYVAACRVVKSDGLWVTAPDMYARQFGLLETESKDGVRAKSGAPTSAAVQAYTRYVKDYVGQYTGSTTSAPSNAMSMFNETARGLNEPETINILSVISGDQRFLHARGLYVDYLTSAALEKIGEVITKCPTGTAKEECTLPNMPFTTINLTELAVWGKSAKPASGEVITVNTNNTLGGDPNLPSGGRTEGVSDGARNTVSTIRISNSGLAVASADLDLPGAVDDVDAASTSQLQDSQQFKVGAIIPVPGDGKQFMVSVTGGGDDPDVFHSLNLLASANTITKQCFEETDGLNHCFVGVSALTTWPVQIKLADYQVTGLTNYSMSTSTCTRPNGGNPPGQVDVDRPYFINYTAAVAAGGPAPTSSQVGNSNKKAEYHVFTFGSALGGGINENQVVGFELTQDGAQQNATVSSCNLVKGQGNSWSATVVWNEPWAN